MWVPGAKADDKTEVVLVLGFNPDGPGYHVLRMDGTITASIHVKVTPEVATKRDFLAAVRADPLTASEFVKRHVDIVGEPVDTSEAASLGVQDLSDPDSTTRLVRHLDVQEVGAHPGHGGSRTGLLPKAPSPTLNVSPTSAVRMTKAEANARIAGAREAGMVLRWRPNPKRGKSGGALRHLFQGADFRSV